MNGKSVLNKETKVVRRWAGIVFAGAATLLVAAVAQAGGAASVPTVDDVLEKMTTTYASLESLEAEIEQVKAYPQLGLTDPPEIGVVYVKRKAGDELSVRLEMVKPEHRIVTIKDGRYTLYQPRIKQAIEGEVGEKSGGSSGTSFMSYFLGDLNAAKNDYSIVVLGEETAGDRRTIHLELTAKPDGKGYYPQIDLWIDQELWMPVQQEMVEPNRSVTTFQFHGIRLNGKIKDSLFSIKLPSDVERVKG
jgi:outer membrane lipoprotein-sorting protein